MKIVIKATRISLTPSIKDFIEEKIGSLEKIAKVFQSEKYFDTFWGKGKPPAEAWVEIEKTTRHHKKGPFFRAEAQIGLPGKKPIRAEAQNIDLKSAIVEVKYELQRQLKYYKNKLIAEARKRERALKQKFRFTETIKEESPKETRVHRE